MIIDAYIINLTCSFQPSRTFKTDLHGSTDTRMQIALVTELETIAAPKTSHQSVF